MLQAHTDMVCTKKTYSSHDFTRDPIPLYIKDGVIHAKDTSLGADDAWGIAYMLAILDDEVVNHPPLECVFTSQEETGCAGVKNLDMSKLDSQRIISMDGDRDVETYVSCFTSNKLIFEKAYDASKIILSSMTWKKIVFGKMSTNVYQGLVHSECGNSIKCMARLLQTVSNEGVKFHLSEISGGIGENFGPEKTVVVLGIVKEYEEQFEQIVRFSFGQLNGEFENADFCGNIDICNVDKPQNALNSKDSMNLIEFVYLLPNNLFQSGNISNKLDCVNNIGLISLKNGSVSVVASDRSRYVSSINELELHCKLLSDLMKFTMKTENRYKGWEYNKSSELKRLFKNKIRQMYNCDMEEIVCPGGLEIAYFVNRLDGIDAVEIGVNHDNPHSVDESMEIHSFRKMYRVLLKVLEEMKN